MQISIHYGYFPLLSAPKIKQVTDDSQAALMMKLWNLMDSKNPDMMSY